MSAKSTSSVIVLLSDERNRHSPQLIAIAVFSFVCYILNIFFNFASAILPEGAIFNSTVGEQSDKYDLDITPVGWAFSIWGVIFIWNLLWFGYGFAAFCRRGVSSYLYKSPGPISKWTYIAFAVACVFTFSWLFTFDRGLIWPSLVILCLSAFSLYVTLFFSLKRLADVAPELKKHGLCKDVGLVNGLHLNALGVYATWCTVASLLNLAMVLHHHHEVPMQTSCFVSLGFLTAEILIWVPVDLIFLDKWTRYLVTPHLVLVWALSASFLRNPKLANNSVDDSSNNSVVDLTDPLKQHTLALLCAAVVATLVKIAVMIYRGCCRNKTVEPV
jgi:hypothetical protein